MIPRGLVPSGKRVPSIPRWASIPRVPSGGRILRGGIVGPRTSRIRGKHVADGGRGGINCRSGGMNDRSSGLQNSSGPSNQVRARQAWGCKIVKERRFRGVIDDRGVIPVPVVLGTVGASSRDNRRERRSAKNDRRGTTGTCRNRRVTARACRSRGGTTGGRGWRTRACRGRGGGKKNTGGYSVTSRRKSSGLNRSTTLINRREGTTKRSFSLVQGPVLAVQSGTELSHRDGSDRGRWGIQIEKYTRRAIRGID